MKPAFEAPRAVAVTSGPRHHFFGYYDKQQWDVSNRYLLAMETGFMDRPPRPDDVAVLGMVDLARGCRWIPLAETRAWCWQQGTMLQWLPGSRSKIIFNQRIGDRFVAIILDVRSGKRRTLPRPIYAVSPDGRQAVSLNFARNALTRPGYGYVGLGEHWVQDPAPAEDGIFRMDLESGNHELVVSIGQVAGRQPEESMQGATHWVNHLLFNPTGTRFIFLHRWRRPGEGFHTRLYTVNPDGSELWLAPVLNGSHFIWYGADQILIWATMPDIGDRYFVVHDRTGRVEVMADGVLTANGHVSVSPDGQWLLTDEYPDAAHHRPLILYRIADRRRFDLGRYYSDPAVTGECRCDLHPRWDRTGRTVSFDSIHEGSRQVYVMDISGIVG